MSTSHSYHHGDLRNALVEVARHSLAQGQSFSLRALASSIGVSATACYRHFKDKRALITAVATQGFSELTTEITNEEQQIASDDELWRLAARYVEWAMENKAVFSLMFSQETDSDDPALCHAATRLQSLFDEICDTWMPQHSTEESKRGIWCLVHGMSVLMSDAKIINNSTDDRREWVKNTWNTMVALPKG